jgi:hypothetical protein
MAVNDFYLRVIFGKLGVKEIPAFRVHTASDDYRIERAGLKGRDSFFVECLPTAS